MTPPVPFPPASPQARLLDAGIPAAFIDAAEHGGSCRVEVRDSVITLDIAAPTPLPWIRGLWVALVDAYLYGGALPGVVASMSWTTDSGEAVTVTPTPPAVGGQYGLRLVGGAA